MTVGSRLYHTKSGPHRYGLMHLATCFGSHYPLGSTRAISFNNFATRLLSKTQTAIPSAWHKPLVKRQLGLPYFPGYYCCDEVRPLATVDSPAAETISYTFHRPKSAIYLPYLDNLCVCFNTHICLYSKGT